MKFAELRKYCILNKIPYQGLRKHELEKNIKDYLFTQQFINEFNFDDDIIQKPRQRKQGIQNKRKDLDELPKIHESDEDNVRVVRARGSWGEMIVDYSFYYYIIEKIKNGLNRHESLRIQLVLTVQYEEYDLSGYSVSGPATNYMIIERLVGPVVTEMKNNLIRKFETFNAKNTKLRFDRVINVDLQSILQKGVYPYEWVDSYQKFSEQLPLEKKDWYTLLGDKNISDHDLNFAIKVYKHFNCKNFGEYHDLYLKLDTILLKDVFDNFRKTCYKNYKLDPVYYKLDHKCTKFSQELELINNQNLYELYENGIRGGISMIPHRHAIANNCYFYDEKTNKTVKLTKEQAEKKGIYNSKKHISYIMYLDCNNLYGYALSQELPIGDFIEEDCEYFTNDIILSLSDHGDRGYTFVVDLEIPNELYNKFKDYPLLPEHYSPSIDELSNYQKDLINKKIGNDNIITVDENKKLIEELKSYKYNKFKPIIKELKNYKTVLENYYKMNIKLSIAKVEKKQEIREELEGYVKELKYYRIKLSIAKVEKKQEIREELEGYVKELKYYRMRLNNYLK
ncbi:hypothetical protein QE152_g15868 [Popillia japonica]|uniref:DNA-directed DNA polymerase n=1 Tax=Popillia japonica TaxID=7064 RepID=A0AAW1L5S9_POPJA